MNAVRTAPCGPELGLIGCFWARKMPSPARRCTAYRLNGSYIRGRSRVSVGEYSLHLYLLGKNNMLAEAGSVIAGMLPQERGSAQVQNFLKWYSTKFE